jgi:hypothetical protein
MCGVGHLQTFAGSKRMSALPPESGHQSRPPSCRLWAIRRLVHRSNHQCIQSPDPWQNDVQFRPRTRRTVKIEPTAQTVRHDVVEDMQAKTCTA